MCIFDRSGWSGGMRSSKRQRRRLKPQVGTAALWIHVVGAAWAWALTSPIGCEMFIDSGVLLSFGWPTCKIEGKINTYFIRLLSELNEMIQEVLLLWHPASLPLSWRPLLAALFLQGWVQASAPAGFPGKSSGFFRFVLPAPYMFIHLDNISWLVAIISLRCPSMCKAESAQSVLNADLSKEWVHVPFHPLGSGDGAYQHIIASGCTCFYYVL